MESRESITTNKKLNKKIFCAIFHLEASRGRHMNKTKETVDIIIGTAWPTHPASLAYALDLRIYYIKNKVDDKCFTKNILFINYLPLFIKEKC
jgi:hypothetical protein